MGKKMKPGKTRTAVVLAVALWAAPANASEYADRIILWLQEQGFTHFAIQRTWLGRIRIEAEADGIDREIILNARTGEILRDFWVIEEAGSDGLTITPLAVPEGMGNSRNVLPVQTEEDGGHDDDTSEEDHEEDDSDDDEVDEEDDHEEEDDEDEHDEDEEEEDDKEDEEDDEDEVEDDD
jgi:hypothetical protein